MPICNANGPRHAHLLKRLGDGPTPVLADSLDGTSRSHRVTGRCSAHGATKLTNAEQRFCNAPVGLMAAQAGAA